MTNDLDETYISAAQLKRRFGGRSDMWIWRRQQDDNFPTPLRISGQRYWKLSELQKWEESKREVADAAS